MREVYMNPIIPATVLLALGNIIMAAAVVSSRAMLRSLANSAYYLHWRNLFALTVLFFVGYLATLYTMLYTSHTFAPVIISLIFFLGALFVWLTIRVTRLTIQDLKETTVSKNYVDSIFRSMVDTLIVVDADADATIKTVNPATINLLGYTEKELVGAPMEKVLGKEEWNRLYPKIKQQFPKFTEYETCYRTAKGECIPVLFSGAVLHDREGKVRGHVFVAKDISERKKMENELKASEENYRILSQQLLEANNLKEMLLDILTHDLKNPAGVVSSSCQLLLEKYPQDELLDLIQNSTTGLINSLNRAVTLAKVGMGETIDTQELELKSLIDEAVKQYKPLLESVNMKIELRNLDGVVINANPIVGEVFINYLSNAIKYAADGKKLIISCEVDESQVTIRFCDFGKTIPESDRERIFHRTVQLDRRERRGRGLGLAIVVRIARIHGGKAWVEPNTPQGNCFCLQIPGRKTSEGGS